MSQKREMDAAKIRLLFFQSMHYRGVKKVKNLRFFKTGLGRSCVYSKSNLWNKKIWFWTISGRSKSTFVILGLWSIWNPPNMVKWTQNWKSMWKPYAVDILYLMENLKLLVIFWTLFSEKCPFSDIFHKRLLSIKWH